MKKLIILAIALRLLVAATYFHPDIKTYHFQASFLRRGVVNIYKYLIDNKKDLPLKEEFVYFPLTYLTLGTYQAVAVPFLGSDFTKWLGDADSVSNVKNPFIFKYLMALKLPYLVLDVVVGYLIFKFFKDKSKGLKAMTIWLFNPFTIILIYIFANVDIIPMALTLVSFLLLKKKKLLMASVMLGLAAGFKLYPLLFVPFLALTGRTLKEKLLLAVTTVLVFGVITLPFLSSEFISSAVVSGLSTRIFNPGFTIGLNETIIVSLVAATAAFFYAYLVDTKVDLLKYFIALFLLIFSFAHFHIQWLIWIAPYLVITVVKLPRLKWTIFFVAVVAFAIPLLYADRSMNLALLRVYSTLYDILPTPFSVMELVYDPYNFQSILHSVLAGTGIIMIYKIFKGKETS